METKILCDICGRHFAEHVCRLCGRRVCNEDYDKKSGMCSACLKGRS